MDIFLSHLLAEEVILDELLSPRADAKLLGPLLHMIRSTIDRDVTDEAAYERFLDVARAAPSGGEPWAIVRQVATAAGLLDLVEAAKKGDEMSWRSQWHNYRALL